MWISEDHTAEHRRQECMNLASRAGMPALLMAARAWPCALQVDVSLPPISELHQQGFIEGQHRHLMVREQPINS